METMDEMIPAYKKINMDNHFSNQNFKLKRNKVNSAMNRNKLNVNIKKKKQTINLNIKNNYITNEKFEKAMKILSDNFPKTEKKSKNEYITNIIENNKNSSEDINYYKPLMVIRNFSFNNEI